MVTASSILTRLLCTPVSVLESKSLSSRRSVFFLRAFGYVRGNHDATQRHMKGKREGLVGRMDCKRSASYLLLPVEESLQGRLKEGRKKNAKRAKRRGEE